MFQFYNFFKEAKLEYSKTVYDQVFGLSPSKAQRTMVNIAEAAIESYVKLGVENTTFESVAKGCKLSRTIVVRYFPEKDDLFIFVARYIRVTYQDYVIQRFSKETRPDKQLETYIEAAMTWVQDMPDHGHAWLLFFYYCGIRPGYRKLNTELVERGFVRVKNILEQGVGEKLFKIENVKSTARSIHLYLSGAIMAMLTEDKDFNPHIIKETQKFCFRLIEG